MPSSIGRYLLIATAAPPGQDLLRGSKADDPVRVRMRGSRMRITVKLTTTDGRKLTINKTYRACASKARRKRKRS
jgi:hypothetical protein